MSEQNFYLYIDGKPVKVSEEVYREYYRAEKGTVLYDALETRAYCD